MTCIQKGAYYFGTDGVQTVDLTIEDESEKSNPVEYARSHLEDGRRGRLMIHLLCGSADSPASWYLANSSSRLT
jgi:hypothetical protein